MQTMESFKRSLFDPDKAAALSGLKMEAASFRELLTKEDLILTPAEMEQLSADPEWLEKIYGALAGEDVANRESDEIFADIEGRLRQEHILIADAWEAAWDRLERSRGAHWDASLVSFKLPEDSPLVKHLRQHPSVSEGKKAAQRLMQYGLTPTMLYETFRCMQLLFDRTVRRAQPGDTFVLDRPGPNVSIKINEELKVALSWDLVQAQISTVKNLRPEIAKPFSDSVFNMLQSLPFLVEGYRYLESKCFEKLMEQEEVFESNTRDKLLKRWVKL